MKHLLIRVYGTVQGVGFRFEARRRAAELGIEEEARNEEDGSVSIRVAGAKKAVERFVEWCRVGPKFATVSRVEVEEAGKGP